LSLKSAAISFSSTTIGRERVRGLRRRTRRACSDRIGFLGKTLVRSYEYRMTMRAAIAVVTFLAKINPISVNRE